MFLLGFCFVLLGFFCFCCCCCFFIWLVCFVGIFVVVVVVLFGLFFCGVCVWWGLFFFGFLFCYTLLNEKGFNTITKNTHKRSHYNACTWIFFMSTVRYAYVLSSFLCLTCTNKTNKVVFMHILKMHVHAITEY